MKDTMSGKTTAARVAKADSLSGSSAKAKPKAKPKAKTKAYEAPKKYRDAFAAEKEKARADDERKIAEMKKKAVRSDQAGKIDEAPAKFY